MLKRKNKTENVQEYTGDAIAIDPGFEQAIQQEMGKAYVVTELEAKAKIYAERNKLYGDNYKRFGLIMTALFPEGLTLKTVKDHNRFGVFVQIVAKLTRYGENFTRGGHDDSLDDNAVYSMMLKELDNE